MGNNLWNSLALGLQRGLNSISMQCIPWPVACSVCGACLTDFRFQILGANDPSVENFRQCLSGFRDGTRKYFSWRNLVKIGRSEVVAKSRALPNKKTRAPRDSSQPPFCPKRADRAQISLNVVTLTCPRIPNFVRIGCVLPDLFLKDWFFDPKSQ